MTPGCATYQALRKLNSRPSSQTTEVRSLDGWIISKHVAVCEHWAECFEKLHQADPPASGVTILVLDSSISKVPPILTENRELNTKLKGSKVTGKCGIPAELLKARGEPMAYGLHAILAVIWLSGTFPLTC